MHSRREFGKMAFGATALAATSSFLTNVARAAVTKIQTTFNGVRLGTCMYCFRDIPRTDDQEAYLNEMVRQAAQTGAGLIEINAVYLEPKNDLPPAGLPRIQDAVAKPRPGQVVGAGQKWMSMPAAELKKQRDELRDWRLKNTVSTYTAFRKKLVDAGLTPFSFVTTFSPDMTEPEIDTMFRAAQALGVTVFSTNQTKTEMGPRLQPFAEKYKMDLGFHNHVDVANPNEIASVEVFEKLFALSPYMKANLDVGHFTAANQDALAFVKAHPDRITHLHMKDRKRNIGPGTPWGEGDAPLKELLVLIRDNHYNIPCIVEYEYNGKASGVVETTKCIEFMKNTLAS